MEANKKKKTNYVKTAIIVLIVMTACLLLYYNREVVTEEWNNINTLAGQSLRDISTSFFSINNRLTITTYQHQVFLTGNESIIFSNPKLIDNGDNTMSLKLQVNNLADRTIKECDTNAKEEITCKDVIYNVPIVMDIKNSEQTKTGEVNTSKSIKSELDLSSGTNKDVFTYIFNKSEDYIKLGSDSITITLVPSTTYNAITTNITQENKMAHLSINNLTSPYNNLVLYMPFDDNYSQSQLPLLVNDTEKVGAGDCTTNANAFDENYATSASASTNCYVYENYSNDFGFDKGVLQWKAFADDDSGSFTDTVTGYCYNYGTNGWTQIYSISSGLSTTNSTINSACFSGVKDVQFRHYLESDFDTSLLYETTIIYSSSTTTYDYSMFNNDGAFTFNSNASWMSYNDTGLHSGGYHFYGIDSYIKVDDATSLDFSDESFAFSYWVRLTDQGGVDASFNKGICGGSQPEYYSSIGNGKPRGGVYSSGGVLNEVSNNSIVLTNNTWNHIVFLGNVTDLLLYVNGVYANKTSITVAMQNTIHPLTIGVWQSAAACASGSTVWEMNGTLDEFMVFNDSLTDQQVRDIYNNQSARFKNPGFMNFNETNISGTGSENRLNVSVQKFQNYSESNVSVYVNNGSEVFLNSSGQASNISFTGDPNIANVTFKFYSGNQTSFFYSPLIANNIVLKSWFDSGGGGDSCTYGGSGNWAVDCSENCTISTSNNALGNLTFSGNGTIAINQQQNFSVGGQYVVVNSQCTLNIYGDGGFNG